MSPCQVTPRQGCGAPTVMTGLGPATHVFWAAQTRKTWGAGPRPVMRAASMSRHQPAWLLGADLCRRFGLAAEFVAPRPQAARAGLQGIVLGEVDRAMHLTDDLRCNRRRIADARPCDPVGRLPCSRWRSRSLARFS